MRTWEKRPAGMVPSGLSFARPHPNRRRSLAAMAGRADRLREPLAEALEPRQMLAVDLAITAINFAGSQFRPGQNVTAAATYRNFGTTISPAFTVRFVASTDQVYGNADDVELFATLSLGGIDGGATVSGDPEVITIPTLAPGNYFVIGKVDSSGLINETNENNNVLVRPGAITILPAAPLTIDLQITAINFSGTQFRPGDVVTGTAVYRNNGNNASPGFGVRFVASADAIYGNADDVELNTDSFDLGVGPGLSATSDPTPVTIPNLAPGAYRIFGAIDPGGLIAESNEANNVFLRPGLITILPPPAPDFTISSIVLPAASFGQGQSSTATVTLRNAGTQGYDGPLSVRLVASINSIFGDADDVQLYSGQFDGVSVHAPAGQTLVSGLTVQFPVDLVARGYAILGKIDSIDGIPELSEANNTFARAGLITITPPPIADLTIATLSLPAAPVRPGASINATTSLRNLGDLASGAFTVNYYLSRNDRFGALESDVLVLADAIAGLNAGAVLSRQAVLAVPANLSPGTYYLVAIVDQGGAIAERSEANNMFATTSATVVVNGAPADVDLSVTGVTGVGGLLPADTAGVSRLSLSYTLRKQGGSDNAVPPVGVYLSRDAILGNADDVLLAALAGNQLGPNASGTFTSEVQVPRNVAPGAYRVLVRADESFQLAESNEANNVFAGFSVMVATPADLTISFTPAPGGVSRGGFITGTLTLRNAGQTPTDPFAFRIGLSADATIDAADLRLLDGRQETGSDVAMIGLAANQIITIANFKVPVPRGTPVGAVRVFAEIDTDISGSPAGQVVERDESNNTFITPAASVTIGGPTPQSTAPDFAGSASPLAGVYAPGQTLKGFFTLSNLGQSAAVPVVQAWLSTDNVLDSSDTQLSPDILAGLPAGSQLAGTRFFGGTLQLPDFLLSGSYFLFLVIDPGNAVAEADEANNVAASPAASISVVRPTVSVATVDAAAAESSGAPNLGWYAFTRTGPLTQRLLVNYRLGGTAGEEDYFFGTAPENQLEFLPGQATIMRQIRAVDDPFGENAETVVVELGRGPGYAVDTTRRTGTVTIADNEPQVSVRAGPSVGEASTTGGSFIFTRSGPLNAVIDVTVRIEGTAQLLTGPLADFSLVGADLQEGPTFLMDGTAQIVVRFAAGQASRTVRFNTIADDRAEGDETIRFTISPRDPSPFSVPVGGAAGASAAAAIVDDESVFSVMPGAGGTEGAPGFATFIISRTGALGTQRTVRFALDGSATFGDDYALQSADLLGSPFVLPDGREGAEIRFEPGQASRTVRIRVNDDAVFEPREAIALHLDPSDDPLIGVLEARRDATVSIADNEAVVSISAPLTIAESATAPGSIVITRAGASLPEQLVDLRFGGSADASDYHIVSGLMDGLTDDGAGRRIGRVLFAPGQTFKVVQFRPDDDALFESDDAIVVDVGPGPGYGLSAGRSSSRISVADNEPAVSVAITGVSESSPQTAGLLTLTRSGSLAGPIEVEIELSGQAILGQDYEFLPGEPVGPITPHGGGGHEFRTRITIPAGAASRSVRFRAIDDALAEGPESITVQVEANEDNGPAGAGRGLAAATIADNELAAIVSIRAADPSAAEAFAGASPNTGSFIITRTGPAGALTVNLEFGGSAVRDDDYACSIAGSAVTFAPNEFSKTITITPRADNRSEVGSTVIARLDDGPGYVVSQTQSAATVTIADLSAPDLSLDPGHVSVEADSSYSLSESFHSIGASLKITNSGLAPAGPFVVQFRLSLDNVLGNADDIILDSRSLAGLGAGQGADVSFDVLVDALNIARPGRYFLGVLIDPAGALRESDRSDNRFVTDTAAIEFVR